MSREPKAARRKSAIPSRPEVAAPKKATRRAKSAAIRPSPSALDRVRAKLEDMAAELENPPLDRQAWAERLATMNEELQATNEELLASNEELHALMEQVKDANQRLDAKVRELETANDDITNLLNCSNIAVLFLDRDLRIKLFSAKATDMFSLTAGDIGRPIAHLAPKFGDPAWERNASAVLAGEAAREQEIRGDAGRWYARRMDPYCTRDNRIDGVVVTFADITESKSAADAIAERLEVVVGSSADAIFSKDLAGTIRTWNRGAQQLYGYTAQEAVGQSIRLIVPDDRTDELAQIMQRLEQGESIEQLETERLCKDGQRVAVSLTVSPLHERDGKVVGAAITARNISEQKRVQEQLRHSELSLRAIVNTATDAILTIDERGTIDTVNPAAERLFGYSAAEMIGQNVKMLMPAPYRDEHDQYLARYLATGEKRIIGSGREVEARRKDGSVFPVDLAVSEVEPRRRFTGIIRDITGRKELEREIVEIASLQQRRIGQDLHDSVGQELTALNLLATDLAEALQTDPANVHILAHRIVQGLQRSQHDLRAVLRGLIPVAVDGEGLMAALADLAHRVQREGKVRCTFECPQPVSLADNLVATHLYLIAQEAVHNAVKHAQASSIRISLSSDRRLTLRVEDDGVGVSRKVNRNSGLGLRIMYNRAAIIGAALTIERARPSGTTVTCALPRRFHAREEAEETQPGADRR